jgi:hypothetical protein
MPAWSGVPASNHISGRFILPIKSENSKCMPVTWFGMLATAGHTLPTGNCSLRTKCKRLITQQKRILCCFGKCGFLAR